MYYIIILVITNGYRTSYNKTLFVNKHYKQLNLRFIKNIHKKKDKNH